MTTLAQQKKSHPKFKARALSKNNGTSLIHRTTKHLAMPLLTLLLVVAGLVSALRLRKTNVNAPMTKTKIRKSLISLTVKT